MHVTPSVEIEAEAVLHLPLLLQWAQENLIFSKTSNLNKLGNYSHVSRVKAYDEFASGMIWVIIIS